MTTDSKLDPLLWNELSSPLGTLLLVGGRDGLHRVMLPGPRGPALPHAHWHRDDAALAEARRQLEQYFTGQRQRFELPLAPEGTPFQLAVLRALAEIPYGQTRTYADIARQLGQPKATRAVGAANRRNPLAIILPCHRVIGSDGSLTGYAGGLDAKRWLLRHEGNALSTLGENGRLAFD